MSKNKVRLKYGEVSTEIYRRTSIPYPIIKAIVYNYLHYQWYRLRMFKFTTFYYFKPIPDMEKLSDMTELEVKRTFNFLYANDKMKAKRNRRVSLFKRKTNLSRKKEWKEIKERML